ncbi:hypothetical protein [Mesorhizobium sp. M0323]
MDPDEFQLAAEDIESDIERVSEYHSTPAANAKRRNQAGRCLITAAR